MRIVDFGMRATALMVLALAACAPPQPPQPAWVATAIEKAKNGLITLFVHMRWTTANKHGTHNILILLFTSKRPRIVVSLLMAAGKYWDTSRYSFPLIRRGGSSRAHQSARRQHLPTQLPQPHLPNNPPNPPDLPLQLLSPIPPDLPPQREATRSNWSKRVEPSKSG